MYSNKKLKMNGDKTSFLTIESNHDKSTNRKLIIKGQDNITITEDDKSKYWVSIKIGEMT